MENFIISKPSVVNPNEYIAFEESYLENAKSIKIDLAKDCDFELKTDIYMADALDYNCMFYRPGTEWGGLITGRKINEAKNEYTWKGWTIRGLMKRFIIEPPAGSMYLHVAGEANSVIRKLLKGEYGAPNYPIYIFEGSEENSGINISYDFRYVSLLTGLTRALADADAKLKLTFEMEEGTGKTVIRIAAVKAVDYSNTITVSQDNSNTTFSIDIESTGITRLICLGKGEGLDRLIVTLYLWSDGSVHTTPERAITFDNPYSIFGKTLTYDYNTVEDRADLVNKGRARLLELAPYKAVEITGYDMEDTVLIGDTVGGFDNITKSTVNAPLVNMELNISDGKETITYSTKKESEEDLEVYA